MMHRQLLAGAAPASNSEDGADAYETDAIGEIANISMGSSATTLDLTGQS